MPRKLLASDEYTSGITELTSADLLRYGNRILTSTLALARLSQKYGRELDRNILTQKCKRGELRPMGRLGEKRLYFWASDIDKLQIADDKRHQKLSD